MKERRRGPIGPVAGIAQTVVGAIRRERKREPRVVLYDTGGHPQVLAAQAAGHEPLVQTAERLVELACTPPPSEQAAE